MHCTADHLFVVAVNGEETWIQAEDVPANMSKRVAICGSHPCVKGAAHP